jgi:hypothetical protein
MTKKNALITNPRAQRSALHAPATAPWNNFVLKTGLALALPGSATPGRCNWSVTARGRGTAAMPLPAPRTWRVVKIGGSGDKSRA